MKSSENFYKPNLLINGDFQVWQRGTNFENPTKWSYTADRWTISRDSDAHIMRNSNGVYFYSLGYLAFIQRVEISQDICVGKEFTLSCSISNIPYAFTFTLTTENQEKTVTNNTRLSAYYDTSKGCIIISVKLSGEREEILNWVKLEQGSIATPFVPRLYAEELAMCQRYYQKFRMALPLIYGQGSQITIPIPMRTTAQITLQNGWVRTNSGGIDYGGSSIIGVEGYNESIIIVNLLKSDYTQAWWSFINITLDAEIK